jgi:hypothetical protein
MYFNFSNLLEENRIVTYQKQPKYYLFITETQKIVVTATKIIFTVVFTRCVTNRCTVIYKFGNKYLPSAYKTQFEFRSYFTGEKVSFWEIQ